MVYFSTNVVLGVEQTFCEGCWILFFLMLQPPNCFSRFVHGVLGEADIPKVNIWWPFFRELHVWLVWQHFMPMLSFVCPQAIGREQPHTSHRILWARMQITPCWGRRHLPPSLWNPCRTIILLGKDWHLKSDVCLQAHETCSSSLFQEDSEAACFEVGFISSNFKHLNKRLVIEARQFPRVIHPTYLGHYY